MEIDDGVSYPNGGVPGMDPVSQSAHIGHRYRIIVVFWFDGQDPRAGILDPEEDSGEADIRTEVHDGIRGNGQIWVAVAPSISRCCCRTNCSDSRPSRRRPTRRRHVWPRVSALVWPGRWRARRGRIWSHLSIGASANGPGTVSATACALCSSRAWRISNVCRFRGICVGCMSC